MVPSARDLREAEWDHPRAQPVSATNEAPVISGITILLLLYTQLKLTSSDLSKRAVNGWEGHIKMQFKNNAVLSLENILLRPG